MNNLDSSSLYRDVIKRSFLTTWRHPWLWIFGFFTTFLGLGSIYEMVISRSAQSFALFGQTAGKFGAYTLSGILVVQNLEKIKLLNLFLLFGAVFLTLALIAFAIWLAIGSFGALISASYALDKKTLRPPSTQLRTGSSGRRKMRFWKSLDQGRRHFWQLLGINLLGKVIISISLILAGTLFTYIIFNNSILRAILYFFIFLILIAASLLVSFLIIYASCFIVIKLQKFPQALKNAWRLFIKNWVVSFESMVLIFCLNIAAQALIFVALVVFSIPFLFLLLLFYTATVASAPAIIIGIWIFTSIIIMLAAGSFFSTFQIVAWTYIFDKISKGGVLSKLHRIFG